MSLYYATKCQSCAGIMYEMIMNANLLDEELGHLIAPCNACHEFPTVLYVTEKIDEARAYNEVIALVR